MLFWDGHWLGKRLALCAALVLKGHPKGGTQGRLFSQAKFDILAHEGADQLVLVHSRDIRLVVHGYDRVLFPQ